jgi:hypothetical protein
MWTLTSLDHFQSRALRLIWLHRVVHEIRNLEEPYFFAFWISGPRYPGLNQPEDHPSGFLEVSNGEPTLYSNGCQDTASAVPGKEWLYNRRPPKLYLLFRAVHSFLTNFKTGFLVPFFFSSFPLNFPSSNSTITVFKSFFQFTEMKFTNIVLAASAASVACAYPRGRDVVPTKQSATIKKRANGFTWLGVSESGAEFGEGNVPGTLGTDYIWPETSKIQVLRDAGMNVFRVPFLMERLVPSSMTGSTDSSYLAALKSVCYIIGIANDTRTMFNNAFYRPSSSLPIAVLMQSLILTTTEDSECLNPRKDQSIDINTQYPALAVSSHLPRTSKLSGRP